MNAYQSLQAPIRQGLMQDMSDPWTAMGGNAQLAAGNNSVFGASQANNTNTVNNLTQRGISANSGIFAQQLQNSRNANASQQNNMYNNLLLSSQQFAQSAATAAGQYQPLQTGGTQTQTNSGLGTWLAPVVGAGLNIAKGFAA
jgi:hypothetical protein